MTPRAAKMMRIFYEFAHGSGSQKNRLMLAMLAAALNGAAPAPAKAAERDPRIVECEAKWGKLIENGQKEGNEKKVAFATKKKLACAEDMAELIRVEKEADEATKRADEATKRADEATKRADESKKELEETKRIGKYLDILALDRPKISSYLKGEGNISKEEARRILREYEHTVDELQKSLGLKAETKIREMLRIHKLFIELAKEKIGQ